MKKTILAVLAVVMWICTGAESRADVHFGTYKHPPEYYRSYTYYVGNASYRGGGGYYRPWYYYAGSGFYFYGGGRGSAFGGSFRSR